MNSDLKLLSLDEDAQLFDKAKIFLDELKQGSVSSINSDYFQNFSSDLEKFGEIYQYNTKLIAKCQEMNDSVVGYANHVRVVLDEVSKDEIEIMNLRQNFESALKQEELSKYNESLLKERIIELKAELNNLKKGVNTSEDDQIIIEIKESISKLKDETELNSSIIEQLTENISEYKQQILIINEDQQRIEKDMITDNDIVKAVTDQHLELSNNNKDTKKAIQIINEELKGLISEEERVKGEKEQFVPDPNLKKELDLLTIEIDQLNDQKNIHSQAIQFKKKSIRLISSMANDIYESIKATSEKLNKKDIHVQNYAQTLTNVTQVNKNLKTEFEEMSQTKDNVYHEKQQHRDKSKQMIRSIMSLSSKLSHLNIESIMMKQHTLSYEISLKTLNQENQKEIQDVDEINRQRELVTSEAYMMKEGIALLHDKAMRLVGEIEKFTKDFALIKPKTHIKIEKASILNYENNRMIARLIKIQDKASKQNTLTERLRTEKETFKKQSLAAETQYFVLQKQYEDQMSLNHQMSDRIKRLGRDIENYAKQRDHVYRAISWMGDIVKRCEKGCHVSENVCQKLAHEIYMMDSLYKRAESEKRKQNTEYLMVNSMYHLVVQRLLTKSNKAESLVSRVKIQTSVLEKSKQCYLDKLREIKILKGELQYYYQRYNLINDRAQYTRELIKEDRRLSILAHNEQLKKMSYMNELTLPRNIHRWRFLQVSQPEYLKMLFLRNRLYIKLDIAYNEIQKLLFEKEEFKKELEKMIQYSESCPSHEHVKRSIIQYENDILGKQKEMSNIESTIEELKNCSAKAIQKSNRMRNKNNKERESLQQIRSKNADALHLIRDIVEEAYFITEPRPQTARGGGFRPMPPENERNTARFKHASDDNEIEKYRKSKNSVRATLFLPELDALKDKKSKNIKSKRNHVVFQ